MMQALGATLNVMVLLLVNMIGYAVGIKGAGRVAGGIFLDREGLLAVAYCFMFLFSGVQASASFRLFRCISLLFKKAEKKKAAVMMCAY